MDARDAAFSELHDAKIENVEIDVDARRVVIRFSHVPFFFRDADPALHMLRGFELELLGDGVSEVEGGTLEPNASVSGGAVHNRAGGEIDLVAIVAAQTHHVRVDLVTTHGTRFSFRAATLRIGRTRPNGFVEPFRQ